LIACLASTRWVDADQRYVSSRASPDLDIYRARFLLIAAMDAQWCDASWSGERRGDGLR